MCPPSQVGNNELSELDLAYGDLEHMNTLSAPNNSIVETPRGIGQLQMLVVLDLSHNKLEQVPASSSSSSSSSSSINSPNPTRTLNP